jgi:hypothetical protein
MRIIFSASTVLATIATVCLSAAPQHPAMPSGMTHEEHLAQIEKDAALKARGAAAMGFDQDMAVHHFMLTRSGGAIHVEAASASDETTRVAVREHLRAIASAFAAGDFAAPRATHDETPPGVATLERLRSAIDYRFVETAQGGRVEIASSDRAAIAAIHEFLRYQITEHRTGDRLTADAEKLEVRGEKLEVRTLG